MRQRKYTFYLEKLWNVWSHGGFGFASKLIGTHALITLLNQHDRRFKWERRWVRDLREQSELTVVEIGVRFGDHAEYMLENLDIKELYLVDPYEAYGDYQEGWDNQRMSTAEEEARARLEDYPEVTFVKQYSSDALDSVPDQVDLIYIDGNHAYEYVRDDIANYNQRVNRGGILAGHDYSWSWQGVIRAVEEFNQETKSQLQLDLHGDWWFKHT
jgi:hypothetical protein